MTPEDWNLRTRARRAVFNAVQRGDLTRPDTCASCGGVSPEAHHPDYTKPLDVVWLCRRCHQELHHGPSVEALLVPCGPSSRPEYKRRWDRENQAQCACGNTKARESARCQRCEAAEIEVRRQRVVDIWRQGGSYRQIAQAFDFATPDVAAQRINTLRKLGYDVPRRGPGGRLLTSPSVEKSEATV